MSNQATIDRIRTTLVGKGLMKGNEVATQGTLKLITNVDGTFQAPQFNVLENVGTTLVGEQRLALTDMFTVTHWGLFIGRAAKAGTTSTTAEMANMKLYTNNSPLVFTTAGDNLLTYYNGTLSITIDREKLIDRIDNKRFWRVGTANEALQQTVTATVGVYPFDQWEGPNYGMSECDPNITFNGAGQNNIEIQAVAAVATTPTGSFSNHLVLMMRGIRWQNASRLNG